MHIELLGFNDDMAVIEFIQSFWRSANKKWNRGFRESIVLSVTPGVTFQDHLQRSFPSRHMIRVYVGQASVMDETQEVFFEMAKRGREFDWVMIESKYMLLR